ncbi:MAG TPA: hypothetical protein VFL66_09820 [Gaiellaceae bacterium]|nr:hypothetical protein [Gaiellaceae bacterium]
MSTAQRLPYDRAGAREDADALLEEIRDLVERRAEAAAAGLATDALDARLGWARGRLARLVSGGPDLDDAA